MDPLNELLCKGRVLLEDGDYTQALKLLREAEKISADNPELCLLLGELLAEEGKPQEALNCLRKVQKGDPDNLELLYLLGDLLLETGLLAEALKCYQRVVELDPDEDDAWVSQALTYLSLEQPTQAEAACRSALVLNPSSTFALNTLGDLCSSAGEMAEALVCYRKVLEFDPEDAQAHLSLAEFYYDTEELEHAEKHCLSALKYDNDLTFACLTLGNICMDQDRNDDAINWFQRFLDLETDPDAAQIRAEVAAVIEGLNS